MILESSLLNGSASVKLRKPYISVMVLGHGESVVVETSRFPLPMINSNPRDQDWFNSITEKLQWNARVQQKPLTRD